MPLNTHLIRTFLFLLYLSSVGEIYAQSTVATGQNFGYTPGQFAVSDAGAATYQIPLILPPGTAGLQPKLGLSYSSQNGNGTLGLGWIVSGLSSISRSARTRAQDETADAIQQTKSVPTGIAYNKSDRFSLDGERLVLAPQSVSISLPFDVNYGENNTVYFTEQNSFTKVIYYEPSPSTNYFRAYTKSGLIFEYGRTDNNSSNSRVLSSSVVSATTVAIQWLVNRIEDRKGNYMTFTYSQNPATGEVYPDRIDYTGNVTAGISPYNSVRFVYTDSRPDPLKNVYGIRNQQKNEYNKRLNSIQIFYGTQKIREYKLTYQTPVEVYSLLTKVAECDGSSTDQQCFSATEFSWSNETVERDDTPDEITTAIPGERVFGDFNGDGLTDIASYTLNGTTLGIQFYTNNGDRSFTPRVTRSANVGAIQGATLRLLTGELNGDNITDVIANWQPKTSTGNSSLFFISKPSVDTLYNCDYYTKLTRVGNSDYDDFVVDLNEDGISDWVDLAYSGGTTGTPTLTASYVTKTLPTTAAAATFYQSQSMAAGYNTGASFANPEELFEDLNNDGLTDILLYDKASGQNIIIWTRAVQATTDAANRKNQFQAQQRFYDRATSIPPSWLSGINNTVQVNDYNADGLPDLVVYKPTGQVLNIYPNRGGYPDANGVAYLFGSPPSSVMPFSLSLVGSVPASYTGIYPNDFNADGLLDVTFFDAATGTNYTYLNKGSFGFNLTPLLNAWPLALFKTGNSTYVGAFLKGSHSDLYYKDGATNRYYLQRLQQSEGWSIKQITNGAGLNITVQYDNLLNTDLYERAGQLTFPNVDMQAPLYVVSKVKTRTSSGDETAKKYQYFGATINIEGRGFRGFTKTIERDTISGIYDVHYFRQGDDNYKLTGQTLFRSERFYRNGIRISQTENGTAVLGYPAQKPTSFHAYNPVTRTIDDVNSKTQVVRQQNDAWGNPLYVVVDYGDGWRDSTANVYVNDTTSWILGRLTMAKLYRYGPGTGSPIFRQSEFTYDVATGLLTSEIANANLDATLKSTKMYAYDAAGNIISTSLIAHNGAALETRTSSSEYDVDTKRFVTKTTNPLGHTATTTYIQKFGLPERITDPNGLTALNEYDSFSRLIRQTNPDGSWKTMAYWKASATNYRSPAEAVFLTFTQSSAGQQTLEHYDSYNRAVQTKSRGFNGQWVVLDHEFSRVVSPENREKIRDWFPYYQDSTRVGYIEKQLDPLGRVIRLLESKNGEERESRTVYSGLLTEYYNANNQKKTDREDAKDRIVESSWQGSYNVSYIYDAADHLLKVRDLKGNTIEYVYNERGDKIRMNDPDMGSYQYAYNGFGELIQQTYPNTANVVRMTYDKLGRLLTRTEPEGVTSYTYDVGNRAVGRVSAIRSYSSSQSFVYDHLGRKSLETLMVNGQPYSTSYAYDTESRLLTLKYPALSLTLRHVYNAWGFLSELRNNALQDSDPQSLFWKVVRMDAKGDVIDQEFGNKVRTTHTYDPFTQYLQRIRSVNQVGTRLQEFAYQFNDLGHLMERQDVGRNKRETFGYDDVNRLISTQIEGGTGTTLTYDELGNILTKSDVGQYEYGATGNGPHRLLNLRTNNANVSCSFTLDIPTQFTSFNKVRRIANDTSYAEVVYGADQQRIMQRLFVRNQLKRTKIYVGGLVEIEIFANGTTKTTGFIGGIGLWIEETGKAPQVKYYLKDHLGSVTGFTGSGGALLEEFSFDAWGVRRNADWSPLPGSFGGSYERGFTNHEHYDLFSLIDMNGRVYDPVLGRFLSPDPFIQDITDLQSLNRYSYVNNNPLSYTDPSGYFLKKLWKKAKRFVKKHWKELVVTAVAVVTAFYGGPLLAAALGAAKVSAAAAIISGAAAGFAANVTGTLLNGGSLGSALQSGFKGAVIGGVTAGLTYGVGSLARSQLMIPEQAAQATTRSLGIKVIGSGLVQGVMAEVQGGNFLNGFISGAVAGDVSNNANLFVTTLVGGTVSELTGGNFTNGAVSAAFTKMFSDAINPEGNGLKNKGPRCDACGSKGSEWVPDEFNYLFGLFRQEIDMNSACFGHDNGYGTLGKSKFSTDIELMTGIIRDNFRSVSITGWISGYNIATVGVGVAYFSAVTLFGGTPYLEAQKESYNKLLNNSSSQTSANKRN